MTRRVMAVMAGVLSVSTWAAAQTAPAPSAPTGLTLAAVEARALAEHPALREAAARVAEARGHQQQAAAWANPVIGVASEEWRPRETSAGVLGAFVQQDIALGGKRADARAAAGAEVAVREAELAATRQRVTTAVRVRYYEVLAAEARLGVVERQATVGAEMLMIARQLVNVGMADRPDVLAAEAEAARLTAALEGARAARTGAWRRLAAAAGGGALAPQPLAQSLTEALAPIDAEAIRARILAESPEVKAAQAAVARERALVAVQRSLVRPDLFLRGDAGWNREALSDGRAVGWQFGVELGVRWPVANRNQGGLAASLAAVTVADAVEARTRLDLEARWATAMEEFESARALVDAYRRDILPRLEQAWTMYLDKYREMATPYPQVLLAQRALVEQHEQYVTALERAWRAALRLQGDLNDGF